MGSRVFWSSNRRRVKPMREEEPSTFPASEEGFIHYSTDSSDESLTNGVTSHLTEGSEDGRKRTKARTFISLLHGR